MKKILFTLFILILSTSCYSQAKLEGDTLTYNSSKYWVGKEVQLWYGSSNNKKFAFVTIGSGMTGFDPLAETFSKRKVTIDKIDKRQGKYYIRGNFTESPVAMNKILIDIEGAIDNKEVKEN